LIGGGGGALAVDQHVVYDNRPLRDLHFTLLNGVYQLGVADFAESPTGSPVGTLAEILAT
jgi:hypothetical protein